MFRWNAVCIDCRPDDLQAVVDFYVGLLGLEVVDQEPRWAALRDLAGGIGINVQAEEWYVPPVWPELAGSAASSGRPADGAPSQAKMMHFEIEVADVGAAVAEAVAWGAREAPEQPDDRDPSTLRVLLDPAGHPFCLWS